MDSVHLTPKPSATSAAASLENVVWFMIFASAIGARASSFPAAEACKQSELHRGAGPRRLASDAAPGRIVSTGQAAAGAAITCSVALMTTRSQPAAEQVGLVLGPQEVAEIGTRFELFRAACRGASASSLRDPARGRWSSRPTRRCRAAMLGSQQWSLRSSSGMARSSAHRKCMPYGLRKSTARRGPHPLPGAQLWIRRPSPPSRRATVRGRESGSRCGSSNDHARRHA